MSQESSDALETLFEQVDAVERALDALMDAFAEGESESLLEQAASLWETLDDLEDIWRTVNVTEAADAVDLSQLPEAIEVEEIAEGVIDEDEPVLDLSRVLTAVELRELWDAVDMTAFAGEVNDLDDVIEYFTNDDDEVGLVEGLRMEAGPATRQAYMEEMIAEAAEEFRAAIIEGHQRFRVLWEENQRRFGHPGGQPNSLNPSAYSTLPPGPVADSASTRLSAVPRRVRHSRNDYAPQRIYGRRFSKVTAGDRADSEGNAAGAEASASEAGPSDAEADSTASSGEPTDEAGDEPPTITRHGTNE